MAAERCPFLGGAARERALACLLDPNGAQEKTMLLPCNGEVERDGVRPSARARERRAVVMPERAGPASGVGTQGLPGVARRQS
jgi:hypothetical protein